ncbi:DUF2793 domain-containing protein [Parageobacillus sp. VR-IP]|uniref:DUF2793 domain-containing protein n=1 Tax=Parageobacillus sp. VR-IP TaxID=2742205 RepID=UPI001C30DA0B|nr:DUF2793 domain-containing protein [Parageobacillus sp. VR-IP]
MIGGEAAQQALEAAEEANTQAIYAQTSGDYAQDKGDYAAQQGDYAQTQGNFANEKGLYAQQQGDYAKSVADQNKTVWKTPVATYSAIATTYPSPQLGWTVMTLDDGKIYRYDGSTWQFTQQYNSMALNNLANELSKQNKQSTVIGHGLNVINSSQNSPLDIRIEGRTLVNVSQNILDSTKYYVLSDKKSKVKFSDGTIYSGVAKFQGKDEKPILIRVSNFEGKVVGSTVENPHVAKRVGVASTLQTPTGTWAEFLQSDYNIIAKKDGIVGYQQTSSGVSGLIAQHLFSFNLIEAIERNVGKIPASDTAGKVMWLKQNLTRVSCSWYGYGSSPSGNKATLDFWDVTLNNWSGQYAVSHTLSQIGLLSRPIGSLTDRIDNNGFVHFIAYAEPSNSTTPSVIYTDYVELEIELKSDTQLLNPRFPLYEVDSTEYANILTTWDENEVMRRYPMVESVQHVQNPYVIAEGENLLPPFSEWTKHASLVEKVSNPYEITYEISTVTAQALQITVNVIKGQQYTFSWEKDKTQQAIVMDARTGSFLNAYTGANSFSFTATSDLITIIIRSGDSAATLSNPYTIKNPMLTVGNQAKPFVPRNPSYLFAEVKLGALSDKKDILWKEGQDWKVTKWIEKDLVLDGNLAWGGGVKLPGFKSVYTTTYAPPSGYGSTKTVQVIKYDGKPLRNSPTIGTSNMVAPDDAYSSGSAVVLSISNVDSGWGENYTPNLAEMRAYFWGWRMCNGTYGVPYDGTGTKTWYPIGDSDLSRAVTTVPAEPAPTISEGKISYYKLSYVRSTPVTEIVTDKVEGDLVVNGVTQVQVGTGVIVREKVTPILYSGKYNINVENVSGNYLKNRATKIINIFKNGIVDKKWTIGSYFPERITSGIGWAQIPQNDYDPTAEYTVTYLVLDRHLFTTNILTVTANYDSSLKSVVDDVVAKQSDIAAQVSVNVRAIAELYKRIKALGG